LSIFFPIDLNLNKINYGRIIKIFFIGDPKNINKWVFAKENYGIRV